MFNILDEGIKNVEIDVVNDFITEDINTRKEDREIIEDCREILDSMTKNEILVVSKNTEGEIGLNIVKSDDLSRYNENLLDGEIVFFKIEKLTA
ncbi:MAG: hypothetical protein FH761_17755 [Firmicutes bacterium]|nr:hypothetical protein [Bacillota bacterium]